MNYNVVRVYQPPSGGNLLEIPLRGMECVFFPVIPRRLMAYTIRWRHLPPHVNTLV